MADPDSTRGHSPLEPAKLFRGTPLAFSDLSACSGARVPVLIGGPLLCWEFPGVVPDLPIAYLFESDLEPPPVFCWVPFVSIESPTWPFTVSSESSTTRSWRPFSQSTALWGGKSLPLNVFGLLAALFSWSVTLEGTKVSVLIDRECIFVCERKIGIVFERFSLVPMVTWTEIVELSRLKEGTAEKRSADLL